MQDAIQWQHRQERGRSLAERWGLPPEVGEYVVGLAADYPGAQGLRAARAGDADALKQFERTAKRADGRRYEERFYWNGETYLIGFNHT